MRKLLALLASAALLALSSVPEALASGYTGLVGTDNILPFQVSVGTTATLLVAARPGRSTVTIINPAAVVLCYGNAGVTTTTGTCLPATVGYARTIAYTGALYAVFASSSATVTGDEVF